MTWDSSHGDALMIGLAIVAMIALMQYGRMRWENVTHALLSQLTSAQQVVWTSHYDVSELNGLPAPVQRYFRAVLTDGQAIITSVKLKQIGSFNLRQGHPWWRPFTAKQSVVMHRPGFVWDARIAVLPGVAVHVHDAYLSGQGVLKPSLLGLIPLADLHGDGELARGELLRYFAECTWYPTALLPSQGVTWQTVDAQFAHATLVDGKFSVTMLVRFNDMGLIESMQCEARGASVGKSMVMMPWECRYSNYHLQHGMQVPMTGEALWITPEGPKPYWRGSIVSLDYSCRKASMGSIRAALRAGK